MCELVTIPKVESAVFGPQYRMMAHSALMPKGSSDVTRREKEIEKKMVNDI